ncbi:hypothetical protein [Candidatus Venteria ishoeyi]|uniref:YHYH domain-containing protein n=2 Tax=Candidatus Venteria ishoeyi TaxID=1899563 RepID=A0A1H6FE91_9GAMM|nr:hypothetical protein [Candidatus Venteria ishoeyi]SEH08400.1 Uncharacterised protein [Candidatus Venteria ishoeyi]
MSKILSILLLIIFTTGLQAHSGRISESGCHNSESVSGGYTHCHPSAKHIPQSQATIAALRSNTRIQFQAETRDHKIFDIELYREFHNRQAVSMIKIDAGNNILFLCGSSFTLQQNNQTFELSLRNQNTCRDTCSLFSGSAVFVVDSLDDLLFDTTQSFTLTHMGYNQTPMTLPAITGSSAWMSDVCKATLKTPSIDPDLNMHVPYAVYWGDSGAPGAIWLKLDFVDDIATMGTKLSIIKYLDKEADLAITQYLEQYFDANKPEAKPGDNQDYYLVPKKEIEHDIFFRLKELGAYTE